MCRGARRGREAGSSGREGKRARRGEGMTGREEAGTVPDLDNSMDVSDAGSVKNNEGIRL